LAITPPASLDYSDHCSFFGAASALIGRIIRPLVAFARLPAQVGFVSFNDAMQQFAMELIAFHCDPNAMHHAPHGRLTTPDVPRDLMRACRLFGVQHQREHKEPVP
jgi:hypothetical protein